MEHFDPYFESDEDLQANHETPAAAGYVHNTDTGEILYYLRYDRTDGWLYKRTTVEQEAHNPSLEKILNSQYQMYQKPILMIDLLKGGTVFLPKAKSKR